MDSQTFDRLVADAARRPSRRAALRLLAGGLLGGFVSVRGMSARAQRVDSDGDGLFDDDEVQVYGTDPGVADTDGDGSDDGQEVYDGADPLVNPNAAPAPAPAGPACDPIAQDLCGGVCISTDYDQNNCGGCGVVCGANQYCGEGFCRDLTAEARDLGSVCPAGFTSCPEGCFDLANDYYNCGACGLPCPAPRDALACREGVCIYPY